MSVCASTHVHWRTVRRLSPCAALLLALQIGTGAIQPQRPSPAELPFAELDGFMDKCLAKDPKERLTFDAIQRFLADHVPSLEATDLPSAAAWDAPWIDMAAQQQQKQQPDETSNEEKDAVDGGRSASPTADIV